MKKRISLLFIPLLILTLLTGCGVNVESEYYDYNFFAMDTYITLRFAQKDAEGTPLSKDYLAKTAAECEDILKNLELQLSAYNENSPLYRMNEEQLTSIEVPNDLLQAITVALQISKDSDGAYNPTMGGLSALWNIKGGGPVPSDEEIREALSHIGYDKITIIEGNILTKSDSHTKIDLGGIGKGYAAEQLIAYLNDTDIAYGLISLGGNIGVFGSKTSGECYKVGITDPKNPDGVIGYLYLTEGYLSVSGNYERYFEENGKRYHHILDPATGYPAESGLVSAACISTRGAIADGLSTALFVMGETNALTLCHSGALSFETILVTESNEVILSNGLLEKGLFELTNNNYTLRNFSAGEES